MPFTKYRNVASLLFFSLKLPRYRGQNGQDRWSLEEAESASHLGQKKSVSREPVREIR
jgi:hypothetical protein